MQSKTSLIKSNNAHEYQTEKIMCINAILLTDMMKLSKINGILVHSANGFNMQNIVFLEKQHDASNKFLIPKYRNA